MTLSDLIYGNRVCHPQSSTLPEFRVVNEGGLCIELVSIAFDGVFIVDVTDGDFL